MSPGLQRAREPYRVKNALLGLALGAFAVGVWAYSISAVKQDVFDDVDEEVAAISAGSKSRTPTHGASSVDKNEQVSSTAPASSVPTVSAQVSDALAEAAGIRARVLRHRGILPLVEKHLPGLLDPERKTLVWGAAPVDNMGKMGDRS